MFDVILHKLIYRYINIHREYLMLMIQISFILLVVKLFNVKSSAVRLTKANAQDYLYQSAC